LYTRSHTLGMAEERIRVARDIHDGIAQGLTAITLNLEAADQLWEIKPEKALQKVSRALELTRLNLEQARRSVLDLHASALQELTLSEAVQRRMQQYLDDHRDEGVTGSFSADGMHGRLSARLELSLYRIFEEALDNVARHSGATHLDIVVARDDADVLLTVSDNGRGFDAESVLSSHQPGGRFGLVAIRERVRLLHGTLQVISAPGEGTRLQIRVPFEPRIGESAGTAARQPAVHAENGAM
ncbi:MAG: sensor histidine kinase, partial [Chloroflexota bacterium]|nr:sensor histidine kinase [Chloroflexota bacterium]